MKRYKIKHLDLAEPNFPNLCPQCLAPDPSQMLPIARHERLPGIVTVTTKLRWPICERCNGLHEKLRKHSLALTITTIVMVAATAGPLFYFSIVEQRPVPDSSILLLPGFALWIIFARAYLGVSKRKWARALGLPFAHEPIKLIRAGKQALRSGSMLEVFCYHPEYARTYREANLDNGVVTIKPEPPPERSKSVVIR